MKDAGFTHTCSCSPGFNSALGQQKWKTSPYHSCCKGRKTEPDCYPSLSLSAAVFGIALGGVPVEFGENLARNCNRRHINPSPTWFLATPLTEFRPELAKSPAMFCPCCFPSFSHIQPVLSLMCRFGQAAGPSPFSAAKSIWEG